MDSQNSPHTTEVSTEERAALVERAYRARQSRRVHPRGRFDGAGRWYPDEAAEGGTPAVRTPSRAWPYSYMLACRTRRWVARLPLPTLLADAAAAQ